MKDELLESVKTVLNLCFICQILIKVERRELLPTVLELMYMETQYLVGDFCIEVKEDGD